MSSFDILNTIIILGIIISGVLVYKLEDTLHSVIALSVLGGFLAMEFILLKAPDVAIAEAAVGAILTPIIFIVTLNKINKKRGGEKEE